MYIYVYVYIILTSQKLRKQISKTNHNNDLSTVQKNRTANIKKEANLFHITQQDVVKKGMKMASSTMKIVDTKV